MKVNAFIPARSGSKRFPHKNIRVINGHPLIAYTIRAAIDSGVFDKVICATDNELYAECARHYGAEVPSLRSKEISGDKSSDIEWVEWLLNILESIGESCDAFSILRPTSPFRKPQTIVRAWEQFLSANGSDSLRAVELCKQHPGKMWIVKDSVMYPLIPFSGESQPWHSMQYAALPLVYAQNASLEIAWTRVITTTHTIAGNIITPFLTNSEEGLDVNEEFDWWKAEYLLKTGGASLPKINVEPFIIK
ncbi:N-acylneuraminate cytidylyltransferase/CMP-N,N'-diacetyllegionaminic acid synthase [Daejeonella rubra]|uniref:N-acylneuraminate cytidylyltransferase/CMP-N,N'-diacetyllegionaminic acid synthase n=1 Tax=Daejeonella rubra TaxID=990371 RepID=A0A1G9WW79_9SPHI|nr:acylneuraminate cytidylyltransferase family protein [Daejeonella rubra]SDM88353.1 N-acylneuraminate cytidylyltransferase/CMP-N,N'-diacetyllegionaminic acid synthase [Daejeonella rubra]